MKKAILLALLLTTILLGIDTSSAREYLPLNNTGEFSMIAEDLYTLDLEGNGKSGIYACAYGPTSYINVYEENGTLLYNTWIKGSSRNSGCTPLGEDVARIYIDDLNENRELDIFVATQVRGEKININPLSYFEREEVRPGIHQTQLRWRYYEFDGIATAMSSAALDGTRVKDLLVGSTSGILYVFGVAKGGPGTDVSNITAEGGKRYTVKRNLYTFSAPQIKNKYNLDGSVYSVSAYDVDGDNRDEIMAGTYRSVYLIKGGVRWSYPLNKKVLAVSSGGPKGKNVGIAAITEDTIYNIDLNGKLKWQANLGKVSDVLALDIDNDSSGEILVATGNKIIAYTSNGTVKWEYTLDDDIRLMRELTENKILVGALKNVYILETDNSYAKNQTAYGYYNTARDFYVNGDCLNAIAPAGEANRIFEEIDNTEGLLDCDVILTQCKNHTDKKELADAYYATAKRYFDDKNYEEARAYAQKAMDIYDEVGYKYGVIWLADKLLQQIEKEEYSLKIAQADKDYSDAYWYYTKEDLTNATLYLQKAKQGYTELKNVKGIKDSDKLKADIDNKKKKKAADDFYDMGEKSYKTLQYRDAILSFDQALAIYKELNLSNESAQTQSLRASSEKYVQAEEYYALAQDAYKAGQYGNATFYANESRNIYVELDDDGRMSECDNLMEETDKRIKEIEFQQLVNMVGIAAIAIVLVIVALAVFMRFRRR